MTKNINLLKDHMNMLCKTIGARPTGGEANRAAVNYAFGVFKKSGLHVTKQGFDCIDWKNSGASLSVDGRDIPVRPAEYSSAYNGEAEFTCVNTAESLSDSDLSGKIAVLYGNLCTEPLMPKNFEFWNPDEHKRIIALLEEKNPAAIITVSPFETGFLSIIQDGDFNIPCAAVCGNALETFIKSPGKKAKLTIKTERIPAKSHNVIASYGNGREKICFSAHIDTKADTPGALDNASGTAVLLTLAEALKDNHKEYPFQIEFALLNGEDYYSTPGEITFMPGLSPEYRMAFNIDGVGLKDSATSISFYECPEELQNKIMARANNSSGIELIDPWPMGDHMMFASAGIPAAALTSSGIFNISETVTHTAKDNLDNINFNALDNLVDFLLSLIYTNFN